MTTRTPTTLIPMTCKTTNPMAPERGVKDDFSDLTQTLTRQFWGVASFLAPPPHSEPSPSPQVSDSSDPEGSEAAGIDGIRSDFAEIGGRFRSGISKLSSNVAVSEFTKIASNFLRLGSDQEDEVGVTEEVVAFVGDIAMHPDTWLDFPLLDDDDDDDGSSAVVTSCSVVIEWCCGFCFKCGLTLLICIKLFGHADVFLERKAMTESQRRYVATFGPKHLRPKG